MKARLLALAICLLPAGVAHGAVADAGFSEEAVVGGLKQITSMAWAPDGSNRLFVLEKAGRVVIVRGASALATPFATLSPVYTKSECGLLGVAFDPKFSDNHYVYFFVSVSATEQQIVRYTAVGDQGTEKTVLVAGLPTRGLNHDGGAIGFGPDGKLYWAIGDNAGERSGVDGDLQSLAAKVSRANADGSVPGDNPFVDGAGPNNDYVWARGFRNPFTMKFQPTTGRLWLNVVGGAMEQVFTPVAGDHGGWDDYEGNQPSGFLAPVISWWTNKAPAFAVSANGATRSAGKVTLLTSSPHRLRPGARVTVVGVADASFNGDAVVSGVAARSLTFAQVGADATSGGGTVTPEAIGGSLVGGEFLDTSAVPASHRQNFVFADYNTGVLMRAELDSANAVRSVQRFASGFDQVVDVELGPDGAVYVASYAGTIARVRYTPPQQALVVAPLNVRLSEGGKSTFGVSLAQEPAQDVVVKAARLSGDADVSVVQGHSLTFTGENWFTPQSVTLAAAPDADSVEDIARLRLTSSGLASELVDARVTDSDESSVMVLPTSLSVLEGESASLAVSLTQPPRVAQEIAVVRSSGDPSVVVSSGAVLTFDQSDWATPQVVSVRAVPDDDAIDGVAELTLSGAGIRSRVVPVRTQDDEVHAPVFTSTPGVAAVVAAAYRYEARARGAPTPVYSLDLGPSGMVMQEASGDLTWRPKAPGSHAVTIRAGNGLAPDATQSFLIEVSADSAPSCSLTAPVEGAVLSGSTAEFFGDVFDDVGATRAEFLVDGDVAYVDDNTEGHYHFGSEHGRFDTTQLIDGQHTLALRGYDTEGSTCVAEVMVVVGNGAAIAGAGGQPGAGGDSDAGGHSTSAEAAAGSESGGDAALADEPTVAGSAADARAGDCGCRIASRGAGVRWGVVVALGAGLTLRRRATRRSAPR